MEFIHDPTFQFILNLCVTFFLGLVSIWLAVRVFKPAIRYETVKPAEHIIGTQQEIESIKNQMDVSLPASVMAGEYYIVTAKIVNFGKKGIKHTGDESLIIIFNDGTNVLGVDILEKSINAIKVIPTIAANQVLLTLPLLAVKESFTCKMLLDRKADYRPSVLLHQEERDRAISVTNVKTARKDKFLGFIILGLVALLWLLIFSPFGLHAYINDTVIETYKLLLPVMLYLGIVIILMSWVMRKMPPNDQIVPVSKWLSTTLIEFLKVIPLLILFFILIGLIGVGIFELFGIKGLDILIITFVFIIMPLVFWYFVNYAIVESRKKRGKPFNPRQIVFLTGIFPVTIVIIGIYLVVSTLLN